jgi:hypothetical protein
MSEQEDSVDSPAFIRQRRNLILASLALVFAQITHLTIEHFNFFGASGHIDTPASIIPYLWVLYGYFLWRYWHAFRAVNLKSIRDRFKEIKKPFVERIAAEHGLKPYRRMEPQLLDGEHEIKAWMPHDEEEPTERGAKVIIVTNIAAEPGAGQRTIEVDLSRAQLRKVKAKAMLHLALTSNEITEYYLPFAIAALPFGVLFWQLCRG